tara:strand:+ start:1537 stop:3246 length:1710 start_codon:yes stop_codon:yes gene_type:complete
MSGRSAQPQGKLAAPEAQGERVQVPQSEGRQQLQPRIQQAPVAQPSANRPPKAAAVTQQPTTPKPRPLIDLRYGYPAGPEGPILVFWRDRLRSASDLEAMQASLKARVDTAANPDQRDLMTLEILKALSLMCEAAEAATSPMLNVTRAKSRDKWIERKEKLDHKSFDAALRGPEKSLTVPGDPSKCLDSLATKLVRNPSYLWHAGVAGSLQFKIARAEAYLRTIAEKLATSTEDRYRRSNRNGAFVPWTEKKWLRIRRSTRYSYIASMRRELGALLEQELCAAKQPYDVLQKAMLDDLRVHQTMARELADLHKVLCSINLGVLLIRLSWLEIWADRVSDPSIPSVKRKRKLKGLPDDWVDHVLRSVRSDAKWRTAAAVMALAGARPAEVSGARSAVVAYDSEAHSLTFDVKGAKVKGENGQEDRSLKIRADESFACKLVIDACLENGGIAVICAPNTKNFRDNLNARIKAVFPKRGVSCYHFRHQVSSDIKRQSVDPLTTAKALGHRSTRTQVGYGAARTGRAGGPKLLAAEASAPVRQPDRQKPWDQKPEPKAEHSAEDPFSNIPKPF